MIHTDFTPFPVLTTDRLILRALRDTDADVIFAHRSDDRVNTYLEDFRHASIGHTQAFIDRVQRETAAGKTILWALTRKDNDRFMGAVSLWNISEEAAEAEAGYTLDPQWHGQGYMNEALVKVIGFGFNTVRLKRIVAYTHERNEGSVRLLLRNGFQQGDPEKAAGPERIFFSLPRPLAANKDTAPVV